jgi:1,2-diacylglycerol-3-alpha-glucose alpha-1,2-glucosyltransferase
MLTVNFLSDYLKLRKVFSINGSMVAAKTQANLMQEYINVLINYTGNDYDIAHSHGCMPYTHFIVIKAKKNNKPIVLSAHQTHRDTDISLFSNQIAQMFKQYFKLYYKLADVIICPTESSKQIVQQELNLDIPIKLISNGVDTKKHQFSEEKRSYFRETYKLDKPVILSIGMPTKRKGFHNFVEISKKMKKYYFLWVGQRSIPILQRQININRDNLIMPGFIPDITTAYSGSDICCFPSYYEGEGLSILEAMSYGLPVIIRDLPAYDGRLIDNRNCLKATTNKEFIERIIYLIDNPQESKRIGQNGLKTSQKYDIRITGEKLYKTYMELI